MAYFISSTLLETDVSDEPSYKGSAGEVEFDDSDMKWRETSMFSASFSCSESVHSSFIWSSLMLDNNLSLNLSSLCDKTVSFLHI